MLKKLHFIIISFILTSMSGLVLAKEYLPRGCQAVALQGMTMDSLASSEKLYFFHNISGKEIWLANRQSPKLTVGMKPQEWNVLFTPAQALSWRCIQVEKGHEQQVACQEVLALCEWSVEPPESLTTKTALWLIENQSITESKAYLQRMGWLFDKVGTKLSNHKKIT